MATVFCFSSTGNSLYAAKKIAERIGGDVVPMGKEPVTVDDAVIGFVFPVYFWGLPRMVDCFIEGLQVEDKEAYVFAVATYGSIMYGVLGQVRDLLAKKGGSLAYGKNIKMVENYIPGYKVNDSEAFKQRIDEDIATIAKAVQNRERNRVQPATFINTLLYRSYPDQQSDQHFTVSSECDGCSVCRRVCPAGNIGMEEGRPVFRHQCEHCLACVHNCPACAVDWKHKTEGKERFLNPGIALAELIAFNQREG
ncbi:MAG: EFR1 family ferrodoxin [Coriobacteriia bacterium]|nr:EFR1 family ferrodoxin [Coriobacteriia bacterium]